MGKMELRLPEHLDEFVRKEAERQGFAAPGEFVREVLDEYHKNKTLEWMKQEIMKGIDSGPGIEVNEEYIQRKRKQLFGDEA